MSKVTVTCDRCGKQVDGIANDYGTSGFYQGPTWSKYMNMGESIVCDDCMAVDERYRTDYGNQQS